MSTPKLSTLPDAPLGLTPENFTPAEALAARYTLPHFILLFEVRDSTGFDSMRSADALAVSLYASRGREITGFEIKVSRSDWLRELKHPEKAEEIGKFCDYFFLVTQDDSIARIDEIPGPWGWMVVKGQKLKILKKPEKLQPVPLDRPMLCSLLYTLKEKCFADINNQITEAVSDRVKSEHSGIQYQAREWERKHNDLQKAVSEFEQASGVTFSSNWCNRPKIGAAVRRIVSGEDVLKQYRDDLNWILQRARGLTAGVERELADIGKENPEAVA